MNLNALQRRAAAVSLLVGTVTVAAVSAAIAQGADGSLVIPAEIEVRGRGWSQLANFDEMLDFALTLIETVLLTSALAFHPVNRAYRDHTDGVSLQKGMFLFSLIGMMTGFLVVHHGYLIGFVIFGIGSLFRFRMEASTIPDTAQLVIVSLIGLAAGLDLPVMAAIATVAAWVVVYAFGRTTRLALEVKFDEKNGTEDAMLRLKETLTESGFRVTSVAKTKFKPVTLYTMTSQNPDAKASLVRKMSELHGKKGSRVSDWHVD
jgi:hypothetical protein